MKKIYTVLALLFLAVYAYCGDFSLAVLNVGQGLSVAVQSPEGKNMVFDCGTSDYNEIDFNRNKQAASGVTEKYLKKIGAKKIDLLVLSHPHTDHYIGMENLIADFNIDNFYYNGKNDRNKNYKSLLQTVTAKKINARIVYEGVTYNLGKEVKCEFLAPLLNFNFNDQDENSNVAKITYKNQTFLLTGDLGQAAEPYLVQRYGKKLAANVLVCGGHGTKYSSTDNFLNMVRPKYAIISCGKNNPYHLPHPSLLKRLAKYGADILRTDTQGNVVLTVKDGKILVAK